MHKIGIVLVSALLLLPTSACKSDGKERTTEAQSMEQIYAAEGRPVQTRVLAPEEFSVYLKFPTTLRAKSESTAYASLSDVVREVKVKVGDRVGRDQVLVSFDHDNPNYQQAKVAYENAQAAFNRSSALFADAGISKQDFDNMRTQYDIARAAFRSASDMIDVKSPIDGYVTRLNVRQTENVRPGAALFTVSNQGVYEARIYVTAAEIDLIKTGARAQIESGTRWIEGSVTEVSLIMDADKKAFPVTATFAGGARDLVSGMSTDVSVEVYRNPAAIVLARKELARAGGSYAAFVARDGVAERRDVVLGRERGLEFEVAGGLRPGEALVSEGLEGLRDGVAIKVADPAAKN